MGVWNIHVVGFDPDEQVELLTRKKPEPLRGSEKVVVEGSFPLLDSWFVEEDDDEWWCDESIPISVDDSEFVSPSKVIVLPRR